MFCFVVIMIEFVNCTFEMGIATLVVNRDGRSFKGIILRIIRSKNGRP